MTNSEIRAKTREQLGGNPFANKWLMCMLGLIIISVLSGALSSTGIGILLFGALEIGAAKMLLGVVRGDKEISFNALFDGFTGGGFVKNLLLGLLHCIFLFLWTLLFVIPGIIKFFSYAMIYYIQCDHPEYDWKQTFDESRRIMNGNKWRLFCLEFSFLGWAILGSLCCGVGIFFVYPYFYTAVANFYEEIRDKDAASNAKDAV